jgi:hypothetical protein
MLLRWAFLVALLSIALAFPVYFWRSTGAGTLAWAGFVIFGVTGLVALVAKKPLKLLHPRAPLLVNALGGAVFVILVYFDDGLRPRSRWSAPLLALTWLVVTISWHEQTEKVDD